MAVIIRDIEQGSEEWAKLRLGVLTASEFSKAKAGGKGLVRKGLMMEMAAEILSGEPGETFSNYWTERGTRIEPEARLAYQMVTDNEVEQVGFVFLDEHRKIGSSPDGLVGEDGGIEIKCPMAKHHIETMLADRIPPQYVAQVHGNIWVTGRKWWDFVSYCPSMKDKPIWIKRIHRDEEYISDLRSNMGQFLVDLDELIEKIKNL